MTPQLSILIIPFLNYNLFLPIIFLTTGLVYHINTSLISLTSDHLDLLKFFSFYRLHHFILLHPSILPASNLRQLVLHILSSCFAQQLSTIIASTHQTYSTSHSHNACISYCFHCNQCQVYLRRRRCI